MAVNTWRKDLFTKIKKQLSFLRDRRVEFPETLTFTTGAKGNLFELGGQDHSNGIAMLIAAPSGKPAFSRILHKRWPNELHAAIGIWPGCLVALGSHHMGSEAMAIYSIVDVQSQGTNTFGTVTLKRLAYKTPATHSGPSPENWYESELITIDATDFVSALKQKLYTYNCEDPIFIEWFHDIKKSDKTLIFKNSYEQGTSGKLEIAARGIDEPKIQYTGLCTEFSSYMEEIRNVCDDLNENFKSKFVYVQFVYFLNDKDELVCQARHFHNNDGPYFPLTPHTTLYTVTMDTQEKVDNAIAFMNKYNPAYRKVIFGVSGFGILMNYLTSHPENTVSNFTKYAKCTARPTFFETEENASVNEVKQSPVASSEEVLSIEVSPVDEPLPEETIVPNNVAVPVVLLKSTDPKGTFLIDDNLIMVNKKFKLAHPIRLGQFDMEPYTAAIKEIVVSNGNGDHSIEQFETQTIDIVTDPKTGNRVQTNTVEVKTDQHSILVSVKFDEKSNTISSSYKIHLIGDNLETDDQIDSAVVKGYALVAYYSE